MKRELESEFLKWRERPSRKPLVLLGARQVGKTWLMRDFGRQNFDQVHEFNFDGNEALASLFIDSKKPSDLLPKLSVISGRKIDIHRDVVIFDEVQDCYNALNSLKYFKEDCPELAVMAAGSLLGVKIGKRRKDREQPKSFPVGMVDLLDVEPLSFGEYLAGKDAALYDYWASVEGQTPLPEILHRKLLDVYREYLIVGGLPECADAYQRNGDIVEVRRLQRSLLELYENDVLKHNGEVDAGRILVVLRSLVPQLAKDNAKFIYGVAKEGARAREYEAAVEWLVAARLVRRIHNLTEIAYPLTACEVRNAFKLYHLDIGLLRELSEVDPKSIVLDADFSFKGRLAENYVLQQLKGRCDGEVRYWAPGPGQEIDFVIQRGDETIPIEVKAGTDRKCATFKSFVRTRKPHQAIRFSERNLKQDGGFVNIPLYLVERYAHCLGG